MKTDTVKVLKLDAYVCAACGCALHMSFEGIKGSGLFRNWYGLGRCQNSACAQAHWELKIPLTCIKAERIPRELDTDRRHLPAPAGQLRDPSVRPRRLTWDFFNGESD